MNDTTLAALNEDDRWAHERNQAEMAAHDAWLAAVEAEQHEAQWAELFAERYADWKDDMLADNHQADITPDAFREAMNDEAVAAAEAQAER